MRVLDHSKKNLRGWKNLSVVRSSTLGEPNKRKEIGTKVRAGKRLRSLKTGINGSLMRGRTLVKRINAS